MEVIKSIVFCAERPDNGPTGGAAGVMYLLRQYLNTRKCKYPIDYMYRKTSRKQFVIDLIKDSFKRKNTYYICHEPDSASILSLLRKRYSLVYHQQGPIVQEYVNHESKPKGYKIKKKKLIERLAFSGAETVFFPSIGASAEYFNSKYATMKKKDINIGKPLYNTINTNEEVIPLEDVHRDDSIITFLSVGTMSELKGQDLSFEFISSFVKLSGKRIRWITVGDGLIKENIQEMCHSLEKNNSLFTYIHYNKIPHGSVLYLDSISDVYLMMHRSSIFDLATLEAMNCGCAVVLSDIGGNRDFNANNNVILVNPNDIAAGARRLIDTDIVALKSKNKSTFDQYFSPEMFSERYIQMINDID